MKYKIKVGNKYLICENANETFKFCDNIEDADAEEIVVYCNNEENARIIVTLLDMDAEGHYLTYSSIFGEGEEPAPPKEERV